MIRSNIINTFQQLLLILSLLSVTITITESTSTTQLSSLRRTILSSSSSSLHSRLLADVNTTPVEQDVPQKHIVLHAKAPDDKKTIFYEYLPDTYDFLLRYNSQPSESNPENFEASTANMVALVKKNKADPTIYVIPCPEYDSIRVYCYDGYGHYNFTLDTWEIEVPEDVTEPTDPTFLYTRIDGKVHIVNDPNDTFFDDIDNDISTDTIQNITIDSNIVSSPVNGTIPLSSITTNDTPNDEMTSPPNVQEQQEQSESKISKSKKNIIITFTIVGTVLTILFIVLYMKRRRSHNARYRRQVLDDLHNTTSTNKGDNLVGYITPTSSSFASSFSTIGMNNYSKNDKYTDKDDSNNSSSSSSITSTDQLSHSMNNRGGYYSNNAKRFSDEPTEIDAADLRDVELH